MRLDGAHQGNRSDSPLSQIRKMTSFLSCATFPASAQQGHVEAGERVPAVLDTREDDVIVVETIPLESPEIVVPPNVGCR
jgi:hypothetical protein